MNIFTILLVFVIVWWIIWFMTLPIGVKTPEKVESGNTESAPDKPRLWIKAGITTIITAILTGIIIYLIEAGVLSIRE